MIMKSETKEQRIVRHADIIVANSNHAGELDNDCLDIIGIMTKNELPPPLAKIRNELRKIQPPNVDNSGTVDLEIAKKFIQKNYDDIKNHLLSYGYINEPDHTRKWILNDEGKSMKKWGGHKKYQAYKKRDLNAIRSEQNAKIYWWFRELLKLIGAAALGYGIRYFTESKQIQPKAPQLPQTTQITTNSTKVKAKDTLKH
jgi:hypothetical protein